MNKEESNEKNEKNGMTIEDMAKELNNLSEGKIPDRFNKHFEKIDGKRAEIKKKLEELNNNEIVTILGPIISEACHDESEKEKNDILFLGFIETLLKCHNESKLISIQCRMVEK